VLVIPYHERLSCAFNQTSNNLGVPVSPITKYLGWRYFQFVFYLLHMK